MPVKMLAALCLALALTACTGSVTPLAPGLVARMDTAGAQLDRSTALAIINDFRASRGSGPLVLDPSLNTQAEQMAAQYAATNTPPKQPADVSAMRVSAGYATFAETFSGWRSRETDAAALIAPTHTWAGLGVAYSANSTYGTHWVILFQ